MGGNSGGWIQERDPGRKDSGRVVFIFCAKRDDGTEASQSQPILFLQDFFVDFVFRAFSQFSLEIKECSCLVSNFMA
jgi:hypothetical protein